MVQGLNTNDKMPKLIILVLDKDFIQDAFVAERVSRWLCSEIRRNLLARMDHLSNKTKPADMPTVVLVKPLPKPVWLDEKEICKTDCRHVMKKMDKVATDFKDFYTIHIDAIKPGDYNYFSTNSKPNTVGYEEFWRSLSKDIKSLLQEINNSSQARPTYKNPRPSRSRKFPQPHFNKYWQRDYY